MLGALASTVASYSSEPCAYVRFAGAGLGKLSGMRSWFSAGRSWEASLSGSEHMAADKEYLRKSDVNTTCGHVARCLRYFPPPQRHDQPVEGFG